MRPRRSFWRFTAPEARAHAVIAAVALWAVAIFVLAFGTTYRDPFGHMKWADFVHFYTLGHTAQYGPVEHLYDAAAQHRDQLVLIPASDREWYFPVYPPQIALVFAPLSRLPYLAAGAVWALVSLAVYGFAIRTAWRPVRGALGGASLVAAAAAAFPPFQSLVLNGQSTAVPILAFALAALALARGRKVLAGLALGLLFMKPQFGLVLAVVVLACREWSLLAGLVASAAAQAAVVAELLGRTALLDYVRVLPRLSGLREALEPRAESMQSIAAVTDLLPAPAATVAWLVASAAVCWIVVRVWGSDAPDPVRMGALALGSMLVNPHVNLYDAAVIGPALLSITGWVEGHGAQPDVLRHRWRLALYLLYALLLFPTGKLIALQGSTLILAWMIYTVWHAATGGRAAVTAAASAPAVPLLATDSGPR